MKDNALCRNSDLLSLINIIWPIGVAHNRKISKAVKILILLGVVLILTSLSPLASQAQSTYCVRAGANGANNGSDWNNAYTSLPSSLVRGATYYVADGSYGSYSFNDSTSGSTYIYVKKAIASDHGTNTGWDSSYGDGQAIFGTWSITTGYWEIDGQFEYGFKVDFDEGQIGCAIGGGNSKHIRYVDFDGITSNSTYNYRSTTRAVNITSSMSDLILSHCAMHNGDSLIQWEGSVSNVLIEYCDIHHALSSNGNLHSNLIFVGGGTNMIFRYNKMWENNAEGLFFTYWSSGGPQGLIEIYGNVIYNVNTYSGAYPRGIELRQSDPGSPAKYGTFYVYNNTFANFNTGGFIDRSDSVGAGSYARNNIQYAASFSWGHIPNSNNSSVSTSQFVNYGSKDLRLASPTTAGYSLPSTYNKDPYGNTRGADGVWDCGAYEYGVSSASNEPSAPKNLRVVQ